MKCILFHITVIFVYLRTSLIMCLHFPYVVRFFLVVILFLIICLMLFIDSLIMVWYFGVVFPFSFHIFVPLVNL
jgi:hypothetical protein